MTDQILSTYQAERELMLLIARFDDCTISTDLEGFRELWTEEAVWQIGEPLPMTARGRDEIVAALQSLQAKNSFFFRCTGLPTIKVNGSNAELVSPTLEYAGRPNQLLYANVARYRDLAVRAESGEWRFASRTYEYIWVDTLSSFSGTPVALHRRAE